VNVLSLGDISGIQTWPTQMRCTSDSSICRICAAWRVLVSLRFGEEHEFFQAPWTPCFVSRTLPFDQSAAEGANRKAEQLNQELTRPCITAVAAVAISSKSAIDFKHFKQFVE